MTAKLELTPIRRAGCLVPRLFGQGAIVAALLFPTAAVAGGDGTLLHVVDFEARGDFEPGGVYSQVDENVDTCEHDETCETNSLDIIEGPEPVRAGLRAVKVTFAEGDEQNTSGRRAEMKLTDFFTHEYDVHFWYGFSVFIPEEWELAEQDHSNVFQIHGGEGPGSSPVIGVRVGDDGNWLITTERNGTPDEQITDELGTTPVQKGVWTDWVMHAVWSAQDDGVLEIWKGGEKVVDLQGWRTLHPDTEADQPTPLLYVKFGYYGEDRDRVLYYDEVRIAKGDGDLTALVSPPGGDGGGGGSGSGGAGNGGSGNGGSGDGGSGNGTVSQAASGSTGAGQGGAAGGDANAGEADGCDCRLGSGPRGSGSAIPWLAAALAVVACRRGVRRATSYRG